MGWKKERRDFMGGAMRVGAAVAWLGLVGCAEVTGVTTLPDITTQTPGPGIGSMCADAEINGEDKEFAAFEDNVFEIIQQPGGNPAFVASDKDVVTQFSLAKVSLGLLAHNQTLAGHKMSQLRPGDKVTVCRDGKLNDYVVDNVVIMQAISPSDPYSDFVGPNGNTLTSDQVFNKMYTQEGVVVLQTCEARNGEDEWGRRFVIAVKE
jgi:hypothetical protein